MYSFSNLEPVRYSMSHSNCFFLTCIQIFQEAGQVVWYSHLFKDFPVCCDPHKVFSVVNEAKVNDFLEFPCFLYDPVNVGNLISGSSAFSKPSLYIWKFLVHLVPKPTLSITLQACEISTIVQWFKYFLEQPFLGIWIRIGLSQCCGHCRVFQIVLSTSR